MLPGLIFFVFAFGSSRCTMPETKCNAISDCEACTRQHSWGWASCRWCPLDRECHALASAVNPCQLEQNIKYDIHCRTEEYGKYNPQVAYEQAVFSTVAYATKPQACLNQIFPDSGFEIVDVINADCDDYLFDYEPCFAYTAVSCARKTILLAFRGTQERPQLYDQVLTVLVAHKTVFKTGGKVQEYFDNVYSKLYPCVLGSVTKLVKLYPDFLVRITGHSLGGAIASLASAALVYDGIVRDDKMSLYTFGMPRVGDKEYAVNHDRLVNNSWRVVHFKDIIPHVPTCNLITGCDVTNGPYHHRTEVFYPSANMTKSSHYIICDGNEDDGCSNGVITNSPCIAKMSDCIYYHMHYFGIPIGTYCEDLPYENQAKTKSLYTQNYLQCSVQEKAPATACRDP